MTVAAAGDLSFLDDTPSARFPVYSRGNVGEITPNAVTPLTATLTTDAFRRGFGELFASTGAFRAAELAEPSATGGVFGGYLYFNASLVRTFADRTPGMRVRDVDRQLFGGGPASDAVPPHRRRRGDRSVRIKIRAAAGLLQMLRTWKALDLEGERRQTEAWLASLPAEPTDDEVVALTQEFPDRFARCLRSLMTASMGAGIPVAILEKLTAKAEAAEPGIVVKALSGLGTIETAQPARDLWRLGRMVGADAALSALFDDRGTDVLGDATATGFASAFEEFVKRHGHRGPDEVELMSDTWATDPAIALAVVERLRRAPASADPEQAATRLAAERAAARQRLASYLPVGTRRLGLRLLDGAARGAASRETAKGTLVLALFGLRCALFRLADGMVDRGAIRDRNDLFMAAASELPALVADPASFTEVLGQRRRCYDERNALTPPFAFEGVMPDPATWAPRHRPRDRTRDTELTGIGVSSGAATGRARIVLTADDPNGIEPGEVLVAPITDPAWTPLFLAACAVVVDVGALQSHAAIVARELGVPAVVSVERATSRIADGDLLAVDGDRGLVTILARGPA